LDICLDAVQLQFAESVSEDGLQPIMHQPFANAPHESVIAKIGALQRTAGDVTQVEYSHQGLVTPIEDQKATILLARKASCVPFERRR
jgi:hypothetical protein